MNLINRIGLLAIWFFASASFANFLLDPLNFRLTSLISYEPNELLETGEGVTVAIVDTGVNPLQMKPGVKILSGRNFHTHTLDANDSVNHGTPVAGIVTSIAPKVSVLPLAVTDKDGFAFDEDMVQAMSFAIEQGASIINLSMDVSEKALEETLVRVGIKKFKEPLFVIAAGNSYEPYTSLTKPWDNVIVVAATTLSYPVSLASYSNYGEGVDIAAPAGDVFDGVSTVDAFSKEMRSFNGTSGSTPVVSAAAALLKERYPLMHGAELKSLLLKQSCKLKDLRIASGRMLNIGSLMATHYDCP